MKDLRFMVAGIVALIGLVFLAVFVFLVIIPTLQNVN